MSPLAWLRARRERILRIQAINAKVNAEDREIHAASVREAEGKG